MDFGQAIRLGYRRGLTFSGRSSRPEFWYFALFYVLGSVLAGRIDEALFGFGRTPVASLFTLAAGVPLFAAGWRRMHDTGRSGLFVLYPLIVMVGTTSFFGFLAGVVPSDPGAAMGALGETLGALGALVALVALFVLAISPLLVIWWLTRPGEKGQNRWGWPPV
ncbi:MAG: DUF805 domain-containing protein [Rhodobacteraceae bacterium]|nr:DUF805 domain-containing protein [Paracoccaceae bacterium]